MIRHPLSSPLFPYTTFFRSFFPSQFGELYYRRNRYTIQSDFARALYFLDGKLANGILDAYRKDDIIKKFLTNTGLPEVDVEVKKVALEEMQPPYKARVDFYMVYYSPDHTELKRDRKSTRLNSSHGYISY